MSHYPLIRITRFQPFVLVRNLTLLRRVFCYELTLPDRISDVVLKGKNDDYD